MALAWLSSKLHVGTNPASLLHSESRLFAKRCNRNCLNIVFKSTQYIFFIYFIILVDPDEVYLLQKTWQDLADRTNGKGIDKETFLQYFPLTGLLGER
jgi:hypothetical protein